LISRPRCFFRTWPVPGVYDDIIQGVTSSGMPRRAVRSAVILACVRIHLGVAGFRVVPTEQAESGRAIEPPSQRSADVKAAHWSTADASGAIVVFCNAGGLALILGQVHPDVWEAVATCCSFGRAPVIQALADVGLRHSSSRFRAGVVGNLLNEACEALMSPAHTGLTLTAITGLRQALCDRAESVRRSSSTALGKIVGRVDARSPPLVVERLEQVLIEALRDRRFDGDDALGGVDPGSSRALRRLLLNRGIDISRRRRVAENMTEIIGQALGHLDAVARQGAAHELGRLGCIDMIGSGLRQVITEKLARVVRVDLEFFVRCVAITSLGKLASSDAAETDLRHAIIEKLAPALRDEDCDVRSCAAEALGGLGSLPSVSADSRRAVVAELALGLRDPEPYVRTFAAEALGKIGGLASIDPGMREGIVQRLAQATRDPDFEVRLFAAVALGKVGVVAAIDVGIRGAIVKALTRCVRDADPGVRGRSIDALRDIGCIGAAGAGMRMEILRQLGRAASDAEAEVRSGAAAAHLEVSRSLLGS